VVEVFEDLFVVKAVRVGLDSGEEGGVGPGLVVEEGSEQGEHRRRY
jgi:hypothetical protein